jgi:hypothetical protein
MTSPASRRDAFLAWFPVASKYLGLVGLVFCATVWALTDRIEPTLLATFGTLLGLSQGTEALRTLRAPPAELGATVATTMPREDGGVA